MNKGKMISMGVFCALTALLLGGCGDGSGEGAAVAQEPTTVASQPLLSETERAICDYENKYHAGSLEMQDYHALADLYEEVGRIREQRDMLEQSYRLYDDEEAFARLQNIAVNLAEEELTVTREAQTMLQNLELSEYLDESVNLISNKSWFDTMMPKLFDGRRNYFLQKDGSTVLTIQVGYDEAGLPYSNVWYLGGENQVTMLQYENNTVKLLQTMLLDGTYDGAFEAWLVDGATGSIRHEQGSFAKGVYIGEYTASIHVGEEGGDLFSLWCNRQGMEYVSYTGQFDEQGRTTLEQPDADSLAALTEGTESKGCVVYAYDENNENCLFQSLEEGVEPAEYSFDLAAMGIEAYPVFTVYEVVKETSEDSENGDDAGTDSSQSIPQIRIFDGEIQWFNGTRWVTAGSAEQYSLEDPFRAYAQKKENAQSVPMDNNGEEQNGIDAETGGDGGNGPGSEGSSAGSMGIGTVATPKPTATPKPAATPTPTKKPSTGTVATPKPAATPAPTPVPTPEPAPEPDDNHNDAPAPNPEPTSAPPADNGGGDTGNSGNDTDIEWSPDIM